VLHGIDFQACSENDVQGMLRSGLRVVDCTIMKKLIQALIQVWYKDPKIISDCSN